MTEKQQAIIGEYNNYFSEGVFVELTEPLFVKKSWVPQWLWNLVSESRPSYFEHDEQTSDPTGEAQAIYNFRYNNSVNDPK